jgi:hypothetical protein
MAQLPPFPLSVFAEKLRYDPATGHLHWRVAPAGNVRVGQIAGVRLKIGYRKIVINCHQLYAHHVAWYLGHGEWPTEMIDHINGDRDDNRLANLRLANQSQQNFNTKTSVMNTSGHKGVARCSKTGRWRAYIMIGRKQKFLGNYDRLEDAVSARLAAEADICGAFSRTLNQRGSSHAQAVR